MKLQVFGMTDVGMKRKNNQDTFLIDETLGLFIVADGMGGHLGGEVASKLAAETTQQYCREYKQLSPRERLEKAINAASEKIYNEGQTHEELKDMGTTIVALMAHENHAYIAQVGDSRVYLFSQGALWQVTEDHTVVQEEIRAGLISPDEVENHEFQHVITRSVGYQKDVSVDVYRRKLQPNDTFLLCSDGLSGLVKNKDILKELESNSLETGVRNLIGLANSNGGTDNITVVVCRVAP
ncbi:MAG: Stp1/IreP family PP2C-type Ser/Thr phosphatase [Deltaproteobacteria bacterium]